MGMMLKVCIVVFCGGIHYGEGLELRSPGADIRLRPRRSPQRQHPKSNSQGSGGILKKSFSSVLHHHEKMQMNFNDEKKGRITLMTRAYGFIGSLVLSMFAFAIRLLLRIKLSASALPTPGSSEQKKSEGEEDENKSEAPCSEHFHYDAVEEKNLQESFDTTMAKIATNIMVFI